MMNCEELKRAWFPVDKRAAKTRPTVHKLEADTRGTLPGYMAHTAFITTPNGLRQVTVVTVEGEDWECVLAEALEARFGPQEGIGDD